MQNNEEYLLRVLHRTSEGLQDSLIPSHGAKLKKLIDKLQKATSLSQEIHTLIQVQGFGKCALAMRWLLERVQYTNEDFSPEQFESDVLFLNEKLFEAFLNQPFDMPDFASQQQTEVVARPVQEIQISDEEFLPAQSTTSTEEVSTITEEPMQETIAAATPFTVDTYESALLAAPVDQLSSSDDSPSLADAVDAELYESLQRLSQNILDFRDKAPNERAIATAVIRVTARAGAELANAASNVFVSEFYQSLLKLIAYADEKGKIKSDTFLSVLSDVGDRLAYALRQSSGGVTLLKNITSFISDPKGVLNK